MEPESIFVETFGNYPKIKIIDFLIESRMFDYPITEIARNSEVHFVTFKKVWVELVKSDFVRKTRRSGKNDMYKINTENETIKKIIELDNFMSRQAAQEALKEHNRKKKLVLKAKVK